MDMTPPIKNLHILQTQILAMALTGPVTVERVEFCTCGKWFTREIETTLIAMRRAELLK